MGCIKSKENKDPSIKYRPESTPEPVGTGIKYHGAEHAVVAPASLQRARLPASAASP